MSRLLGYRAQSRSQGEIAILPESSFATLCSTFRDLDVLFRAAVQRGCGLKSLQAQGAVYDDWKVNINIDEQTKTKFDPINEPRNDLQYIQDMQKLGLWSSAMDFMEVEHEGFQGRMVLKEGGGYKPFPKPAVLRSGWSSHIDRVAEAAMRLPSQVLDAAKNGNLQDPRIFRSIHARVVKLDGFLNRTRYLPSSDARPQSLATQIDRSWPWAISQIESFSIATQVATAYPGYQRGTITVLTVVGIVSVISCALALISVQISPKEGFWNEADFFSLCQQSLVSISGIIILICTVFFRSSHVAKQAWHSAWVLAMLSLATAIAAVPLYGLISPKWSTAFAAVSGILQMWISVMLMFIVSN